MKHLTTSELSHVLGGFAGPELPKPACNYLQEEAAMHKDDPNFDWDDWADRYEQCVAENY